MTPTVQEAADHTALLELNDVYIRSAEASDVSRFKDILAEDFHCARPDGSLVDKAQFLKHVSEAPRFAKLRAHDVQVQMLGKDHLHDAGGTSGVEPVHGRVGPPAGPLACGLGPRDTVLSRSFREGPFDTGRQGGGAARRRCAASSGAYPNTANSSSKPVGPRQSERGCFPSSPPNDSDDGARTRPKAAGRKALASASSCRFEEAELGPLVPKFRPRSAMRVRPGRVFGRSTKMVR